MRFNRPPHNKVLTLRPLRAPTTAHGATAHAANHPACPTCAEASHKWQGLRRPEYGSADLFRRGHTRGAP
eukprot:CAMPEP_0170320688 /NCGR_PEP_ID=MMETSP0116_2-20130129/61090_1 /TAXON_ID=400756 /ORGANISM="Durinskia baltica, Strain CSIRO CS-38" /LENGTH=69 /DNA_ID=CAMNT_0010573483 /DNA_START=21 /DNA_END=227 /DNA_ORIENTATION=-